MRASGGVYSLFLENDIRSQRSPYIQLMSRASGFFILFLASNQESVIL